MPAVAGLGLLILIALGGVLILRSGTPTPTVSVNDVSASEGNAGTTSFNFTVSLSIPAGVGGVTFDIATADGGATAVSNDYVAQSLTGRTEVKRSRTSLLTPLIEKLRRKQ